MPDTTPALTCGKRTGKTAMFFAEVVRMGALRGFISEATAISVIKEFNQRMSGRDDAPIALPPSEDNQDA